MRRPKAPKDPTKKRPSLYLMLDKDIAGLPGRDGSCRDTNYMEGRLVEQVKGICGDVDEDILKLLESFEGIRKLVHRALPRMKKQKKAVLSILRSIVMEKRINTLPEAISR